MDRNSGFRQDVAVMLYPRADVVNRLPVSTVLIVSQVYVPDTPSAGQHLHDLARELVRIGKRVIVMTPRGGYDDRSVQFEKKEIRDGIELVRFPLCAFGKKPVFLRLLGGMSLVLQSMFRGIFVSGLSHVLVGTAPPMAVLGARFIARLRRARTIYWVMDLNPDQMIASGHMKKESLLGRVSEKMSRWSLKRVDCVVALDSYMAKRLESKVDLTRRMHVIPPWPYDEQLADIRHDENPFRATHGLGDQFVVMYSGNITDVHPLDTIMKAIVRLKDNDRILFLFVGAKAAIKEIDAFAKDNQLTNVRTMGYVPLSETKYSLSAADVHVVTMGDAMVGIVHPCKIYGIMSVGRPILALAPNASHVGEIIISAKVGWSFEHGDVEGVVRSLTQAEAMSVPDLMVMGQRGRDLVRREYSRSVLCSRFAGLFE